MRSAAVTPQDMVTPFKSSVTGDEVPAESEGGSTPRSVGSPHIGAYRPEIPRRSNRRGFCCCWPWSTGPEPVSTGVKADDQGWIEVKKSPRKEAGKVSKKSGKRAGSGSSKSSMGKGQRRVGNASNVLTVQRPKLTSSLQTAD